MHKLPQILVTRPEPDASDTAARLAALGLQPLIAPMLEMHVLDTGLPDPKGLSAIALTSANALRALEARDRLAHFHGLPVFTVGDRTAAHARDMGFTEVTSADGSFDDLVALLLKQKFDGPVFYPAAANARGDLAGALAPTGIMVLSARLYDMQPVTSLPSPIMTELAAGTIPAISFYSRHTAASFCALVDTLLDREGRAAMTMLCLSENVAEPLIDNHFTRIALADYPSEEAMMALALSFARDQIR